VTEERPGGSVVLAADKPNLQPRHEASALDPKHHAAAQVSPEEHEPAEGLREISRAIMPKDAFIMMGGDRSLEKSHFAIIVRGHVAWQRP
jgi:hypothetical protein